jgi:hypothetical protein
VQICRLSSACRWVRSAQTSSSQRRVDRVPCSCQQPSWLSGNPLPCVRRALARVLLCSASLHAVCTPVGARPHYSCLTASLATASLAAARTCTRAQSRRSLMRTLANLVAPGTAHATLPRWRTSTRCDNCPCKRIIGARAWLTEVVPAMTSAALAPISARPSSHRRSLLRATDKASKLRFKSYQPTS